MKKLFTVLTILLVLLINHSHLSAQTFKFYYNNQIKFLKYGTNDSLKMPFTGGLNAPQISNIDLNNDGVKDLFIFDKTGSKALTFLRKNGAFEYTPFYDGKFPPLNDWAQLRDFDGDGRMDIYTEVSLDRAQLVDTIQNVSISGVRIFRNMSATKLEFKQVSNQVMDTGGVFGGFPVDKSNININYTDIGGIGDLDNDGDADILAFVQASLSPYYYENFMKNKNNTPYPNTETRYIWRDQCWGYIMYDPSFQTNTFKMGMGKGNDPNCVFQMYKHQKHANNTMCILDANGDGVSDIVYGDGGYTNLNLLVNGRDKNSLKRDSIIAQDTAFPSNTTPANFIIFPVAYYVDTDGDGVNELLVTTNEPLSAKSTNNVWTYENTGTTAKPVFSYVGNKFFVYDETVDLGTRSSPATVDIDGDGDLDLIIGTSGDFDKTKYFNDRLVFYRNKTKVAGRAVFELADTNFMQISKDTPVLNAQPAFGDLNNDGKIDMVIGDLNGLIQYYSNTGTSTSPSFKLETRALGDIDVGSNACPALFDLDKDGDLDLIVGNRNGYLKYYANTGSANSPSFANTPTIDTLGKIRVNFSFVAMNGLTYTDATGYATPTFYDLDSNGTPELIVGSGRGNVFVYTNVSANPGAVFNKIDKLFVDFSDSTNARSITFGVQSRPCVGLFDEDTKPDLFVGNIRGGISFYGSRNGNSTINPGIGGPENGKRLFKVYPNPTQSLITIDHGNADNSGTIEVINLVGQSVMTTTLNHYISETTIDMSSLQSGIYFIKITSGNYTETTKVIKN